MTMIYLIILIFGLAIGSFINAFVWRFYQQKNFANNKKNYSIITGRSVCTHCQKTLSAKDLVPIVSWLLLRGRCRYCRMPIEDTPIAELLTAILFVASFYFWPFSMSGIIDYGVFLLWLVICFLLIFLFIYDLRWMVLPDIFVLNFTLFAIFYTLVVSMLYYDNYFLWSALSGGAGLLALLYGLYVFSSGRWIGGGDVKLIFGLGLLAGSFLAGAIAIFVASLIGTILFLPGLIKGTVKPTATLPFGPLLIIGTMIVFFGIDSAGLVIDNFLSY